MERYNEEEIRRCYRFLAHKKQTEIRLIDPKKINRPFSVFVNNEDDFVGNCKKYNGLYNIYAGINERENNGTDKSEVIGVKTIVLDIDAVRERGYEKEPATEEELKLAEKDCDEIMLAVVKSSGVSPTKIFSGNGWQIWFAIPKIEINDENRNNIEDKIQKFQDLIKKRYEKLGSIDKIGDLPRIIKVWGTLNIKSSLGVETVTRPFRIAHVSFGGERNEDTKFKQSLMEIEVNEDNDSYITIPLEEINKEFIPRPISYILYEYQQQTPENWLRIIETLSSFFRGIGLNQDKTISHLIEWSRRQPYRENGEEQEIVSIVKRIFKNGINCPNFDKLVFKEEGYPFFGLKNIFEGIELGDDWKQLKNPIKYYKTKEDRSKLNELEKVKLDVRTMLLTRNKDNATEEMVKYILKNNKLYTTRDDIKSEVWIYKEGVYKPNGKTYIKEVCRDILGEAFTISLLNDVISKIEPDTYIEQDIFFNCESKEEIAMENGILNIFTRELKPFDPTRVFFNKLPVIYVPEAKCPSIEKFFKDILRNEEDSKVMFELIGYSLLKDYFIEKAFMWVGNGRNGKGKSQLLIKKFLGIENCAAVPLSQINASSTSVCELHGKLVNMAGDISNTDLKETGMFKQLCARDLICAKRKYLRDLFFTNYAKLMFACNELPKVYDSSVGFWSRWILLEFPFEFTDEANYNSKNETEKCMFKIRDEQIIDKISTTEEMSGLLNMALDGLDRILKQKDFSYTRGTQEVKEFWVRKSDSFTAFCMDNLVEDEEGLIPKKDIRKHFMRYCKKYKLKGASDKAIKVILEDMFGVTETRGDSSGDWAWGGIKWKWDL